MDAGYLATLKADVATFKEYAAKFYNKEIAPKDYKGLSGGFGSYAQRGGEVSMLRLRLGAGQLTKDKLKFLADSIEKYQVDKIHFTTCQTVQFHNLGYEALCDIMESAYDHGIIPRGGGGDFPRNVMTSPLSGVEKNEYFNVLPYAQAAADYLLSLVTTIKMPRKLKVCFSNSPKNEVHGTFRDLGFIATPNQTFDVYSAGGLGNNPKMGLLVAKNIAPNKILYYIKAMILTFMAHGNYENRAKARTRYMQEVLGEQGYIDAYLINLQKVMDSDSLDISVEDRPITKAGDGTLEESFRVISQKQEGLYAVYYHPLGGTPNPQKLIDLYNVIKDMPEVELRLTPNEGLYIINLTAHEAEKVLDVTSDGAENPFLTSVACIGAGICQQGVRDSQQLIKTLAEVVSPYNFAPGVLPQLHISGCPSSCGTHQIGRLGFHGCAAKAEGQMQPAFTLHFNGYEDQASAQFGDKIGVILETNIPKFIVELGQTIEAAQTTFEPWIKDHKDEFIILAEKYTV